MCGIVGYVGNKDAVPVLIEGLKNLEYRGYDSAGIAVLKDKIVHIKKYPGKLKILEGHLEKEPICANLGIGHTRWATHGIPSKENAHPHTDCIGNIVVVHNGIIENHEALRKFLINEGHTFKSETDTEVIPHLIEKYYRGDLFSAVQKAIKHLKGTYAINVLCKEEPGVLIGVRNGSPLIIGIGDNEMFFASDVPAILKYTHRIVYLEENEIAVLKSSSFQIFNRSGKKISRESTLIDWDISQAKKGGYPHFMLKEIFEQPHSIADTINNRIRNGGDVVFEKLKISEKELKKIKNITIISCGTAWHAGLIGKYMLEEYAQIPVEVDIASEFRYRKKIIDKNTLILTISQSGETADTLAGVREAKKRADVKVLSICNVMGSTLTRESDGVLYTYSGPEIAVASTKAYTSQLVVLALLSIYLGRLRGVLDKKKSKILLDNLKQLPGKIKKVLNNHDVIKYCADKYFNVSQVLCLGRSYNFPTALEAALKLKEISYINAEGYGAGEMKHGPIALINEHLPVICIATKSPIYDKMISNIQEIKARKGIVIALASEKNKEIPKYADHLVYLPDVLELFSPILNVIPLQLFAYYVAVNRKCDVDQPRNLAKSVTVE